MTERTGFEANARLLRLLVGSNLYPTPDVCVRELLQNAWDAIELRRASGDGFEGSIVARFSAAERWFEVEDDGIGMSRDDVKASFLSVGSDKLEVLGVQGQAGEQVAFFGIGVLSVFLVASHAELVTRKASEEQGVRVGIEGLDQNDVEIEAVERDSVGTTVRVWIGSDTPFDPSTVPEAVRKYARHVPGIFVEDQDTGSQSSLEEIWDTEGLNEVSSTPEQELIREGRLGFIKTLTDETPVVSNPITLCNGGFLVEAGATDLLQIANPLGFGGEVDLHPNALTVVMAREHFQRDGKWVELGQALLGVFEEKAIEALSSGFLANNGEFDPPDVRRCLLVWHWALREIPLLDRLKAAVKERVLSTVPFQVAGSDRCTSIKDALDGLPEPRLYYRRVGGPTYMSRQIEDEGLPISFNEEIGHSIRIGALRARGLEVLETAYFTFTWQLPGQPAPASYQLDEYQVVSDCLSGSGTDVLEVGQAPESDLNLDDLEKLPALRKVLDVGGGELRLASVPGSTRRVVADPSGVRYLNVDHPRVRRLLSALPDAVANPLKRRLLSVYLGLETFSVIEARNTLLEMLEDDKLAAMAQTETSVLTRRAVRRKIDRLLAEQEET